MESTLSTVIWVMEDQQEMLPEAAAFSHYSIPPTASIYCLLLKPVTILYSSIPTCLYTQFCKLPKLFKINLGIILLNTVGYVYLPTLCLRELHWFQGEGEVTVAVRAWQGDCGGRNFHCSKPVIWSFSCHISEAKKSVLVSIGWEATKKYQDCNAEAISGKLPLIASCLKLMLASWYKPITTTSDLDRRMSKNCSFNC